jgi:DNA repair protein RecN (Recombination protein N)
LLLEWEKSWKEMSLKCKFYTHLPQIAAKGNAHFKVFKSTVGDDYPN